MKITRKRLDTLKASVSERKEKASDLDVLVAEIMKLPPGQLKKVLTDEVIAVLSKYGYTDE